MPCGFNRVFLLHASQESLRTCSRSIVGNDRNTLKRTPSGKKLDDNSPAGANHELDHGVSVTDTM
eukprot:1027505-Amphidinium_carterae.1